MHNNACKRDDHKRAVGLSNKMRHTRTAAEGPGVGRVCSSHLITEYYTGSVLGGRSPYDFIPLTFYFVAEIRTCNEQNDSVFANGRTKRNCLVSDLGLLLVNNNDLMIFCLLLQFYTDSTNTLSADNLFRPDQTQTVEPNNRLDATSLAQ